MTIDVREYCQGDIPAMIAIWNEIVVEGIAFPQVDTLDEESGREFFAEQSFTGVALEVETSKILGLYILHPNNIGRCGHISNSSYAVKSGQRGKRIGEHLVLHSIAKARDLGFLILQFNAVVKSNRVALHLYQKLGFVQLGIIPKGFLMKDGSYEDIVPHYYML